MSIPFRSFSFRLAEEVYQQIQMVAAARRTSPAALVREFVERGLASLGGESAEAKRRRPSIDEKEGEKRMMRMAHAAIFAELSLEQFTASEDQDLAQQLHTKAASKVAEMFGTEAPPPSEQGRQRLQDEQREIAKKFANG